MHDPNGGRDESDSDGDGGSDHYDQAAAADSGYNWLTIAIDKDTLSDLSRRRRRRLRELQKATGVLLKFDRVKGCLQALGDEESLQKVQQRLATCRGPRKQVSLAVWAELMRTRKLLAEEGGQSGLLSQLQQLTGCRIHIERNREEVRLFGEDEVVGRAWQLLDSFESLCCGERIWLNTAAKALDTAVLHGIAEGCGVSLRLEVASVHVLGLKQLVPSAAQEIACYITEPISYKLPEHLWPCKPPPMKTGGQEGCGLEDDEWIGDLFATRIHSRLITDSTVEGTDASAVTEEALHVEAPLPQYLPVPPQDWLNNGSSSGSCFSVSGSPLVGPALSDAPPRKLVVGPGGVASCSSSYATTQNPGDTGSWLIPQQEEAHAFRGADLLFPKSSLTKGYPAEKEVRLPEAELSVDSPMPMQQSPVGRFCMFCGRLRTECEASLSGLQCAGRPEQSRSRDEPARVSRWSV